MSTDQEAVQMPKESSKDGRSPEINEVAERLKEGNFNLLLELAIKAALTPSDCRAVLATCAKSCSLRSRCSKSIEYLIQRAADELRSPDENGDTLGQLAARSGNLMLLALLPREVKFQGNSVGFTPFMEAAKSGEMRCAKHLMHQFRQKQCLPAASWQASLCGKNSDGQTALDIAKQCGRDGLAAVIEAELKLLKNGLTLEQEQIREKLQRFALAGSVRELKPLATSANCDLPDGGGKTVLMRAAECKSAGLEVLKLLADIGDPTAVDANGWTSLHHAAAAGWEGAVRVLADAGAAINCGDHKSWTPLMQAASLNHEAVIKALLELHANWQLLDADGNTAMYQADRACRTMASKLLCQFADKPFFQVKQLNKLLLASSDSAAPAQRQEAAIAPPTLPARTPELQNIPEQRVRVARNSSNGNTVTNASERRGHNTNIESKSIMKSLQIGKLIGRGAFGSVFLANLPDHRDDFCAKFIDLPINAGEHQRLDTVLDTIHAELNLCRLVHKNIVKFVAIEYNMENSQIIVVMDLVRGKTLTGFLQGKPVGAEVNRELSAQICSALEYMHGKGVIHRDLNGNNIFVTGANHGNQVTLIDFGLSQRLHRSASHCTESGTEPKGTANFMAPERFSRDPDSDDSAGRICPKSDVWSLGCAVYLMATGSVPYAGVKNSLAIALKISTYGAPRLVEPCDRELADFYAKCTDKSYVARKSAAELMEHPFLMRPSGATDMSSQTDDDNDRGDGGRKDESRQDEDPSDRESGPTGRGLDDGDSEGGPSGSQGTAASEGNIGSDEEQDITHLETPSNLDLPSPKLETSLESCSRSEDGDIYRVTSPRGICLIINVEKYDSSTLLEAREGSRVDVDRVSDLFSRLGFIVRVEENPTQMEIVDLICAVSALPEHSDFGCFVCFIMAHGSSGSVYGRDGQAVGVKSILQPLQSVHCDRLRNKPKIFFIQACRGSKCDLATDGSNAQSQPAIAGPPESDFLICFSSIDGGVALRHPISGSPFLQTLCDVISKRSHQDHLTDIMLRVNSRLKETQLSIRSGFSQSSVTEIVSTLSRKCYLNSDAFHNYIFASTGDSAISLSVRTSGAGVSVFARHHDARLALATAGELSMQLHESLSSSGFTRLNAAVQSGTVAVLEQIIRKRLVGDCYLIGSFADGWGNCLSGICGLTDADSDIDFTVIETGVRLHLARTDKRSDCKEVSCKEVEYRNGHVMYRVDSSKHNVATSGMTLKPAADTVIAYPCCEYPEFEVFRAGYKSCIHEDVLSSLKCEALKRQFKCHVVAAAPPSQEGQCMRVSTSFLERRLMRGLSTIQGQLFIMLKYLIKRVIVKRVKGLTTYHGKNLLFHMLDRTPAGEWQPQNLMKLLRQSLQLLIDSLTDSSGSEHQCMWHFFMRDAATYLRRDHEGKAEITRVVSHVIDELPHLMSEFEQTLMKNSPCVIEFHPFLILPIVNELRIPESDEEFEYHQIYDAVRRALEMLGEEISDSDEASHLQQLGSLLSRIPDCARTARESLRALMRLREGKSFDLCVDSAFSSNLIRGIHCAEFEDKSIFEIESRFEARCNLVWEQLKASDSAWKFMFEFHRKPDLSFLPKHLRHLRAAFPWRVPSRSSNFVYINFHALMKSLQLEARKLSGDEEGEEALLGDFGYGSSSGRLDTQELLLMLHYCSDEAKLVEAIHGNREMIVDTGLAGTVLRFLDARPTLRQRCVETTWTKVEDLVSQREFSSPEVRDRVDLVTQRLREFLREKEMIAADE